jgi:deoxyribodipyrimidine photolyase
MRRWRRGERYFMENLIDGDFASNHGGWGFGSSTGVDPKSPPAVIGCKVTINQVLHEVALATAPIEHQVLGCDGKTGFPIVDAAMRQLRHCAWMHNRTRMVVSSFFTKSIRSLVKNDETTMRVRLCIHAQWRSWRIAASTI